MTEPFHFPDGRAANDAKELLELCEQYPDAATGFLVGQDLEKWLAYIGSYDIAECATNARQVDVEDRQKLEDFINKCHSLNSSEPVIPAETPTNIQDNMTAPESATVAPTETADPQPAPAAEATAVEKPAKAVPTEISEPAAAPVKQAAPPQKPTSATPPPAKPPSSSSSTESEEKPSFFQVVAKFIVKILYRDKA